MDDTPDFQPATATAPNKLTQTLWLMLLIMAILYFGRSLFIPLSFAVLISFVLYPICSWLQKKGLPYTAAIAVSLFLILIILAAVVLLLILQLNRFTDEWPALHVKLHNALLELSTFISYNFSISIESQEAWWKSFSDQSGKQILPLLKTTLGGIGVSVVYLILIPIISALILYQRHQLFGALHLMIPTMERKKLKSILSDTVLTYYNFIIGMMRVYLIVGVLNSIGLLIIGVPNAFLFGFIAAILTFIPYVGIMIGAILPMAISWLTFNSIWYPAGVVLVFAIVQYLEANVIFPWAVSSKLQISTLATIVAILAGGILWGTAGMILFVPYIGILKLLADRTEGMQAISLLLGNHPAKKG